MKYLRPRSADSGLVTVLLVSDIELEILIDTITAFRRLTPTLESLQLKKLHVELKTARKAL